MQEVKCKVGLFSIGLDTYWNQFEGLHQRLLNHHARLKEKLMSCGVDIADAGLVDNPEKATVAADYLKSENVELIVLFITTYALSSTVLPVVQRAKVPIIVLNLQPVAQLDYVAFNKRGDRAVMTGLWLEHCQACCLPELTNVFNRAGIDYHLVSGFIEDKEAWTEIGGWLEAARVAKDMRNNRVGVLGNYYGGMLDVYSDLTQHSVVFGNHFEMIEMCELNELRKAVASKQIGEKLKQFHDEFDVSPECSREELERAARTSCGLDLLVQKRRIGSLAYYYEGTSGNEYENIVTSMIAGNTLLTGHHVPVAGEYEIKNVQAMKILDLFGLGGSFSEFYLSDYRDDILYLGHDGPAHCAIAQGRVGLVPLPVYHGKPGKGLSIQMTVRHGPITVFSVAQKRTGELFFLTAEGESVEGSVLQIGNTNSRYRFAMGVRRFLNAWSEAGPSHHCAIGLGHNVHKISKLAKLLHIDHTQIV
jgi:L-arabinose isomerase